jgi:hypothetical protein
LLDNGGVRKLDEIVASGAYEKSDFKPTIKSKNIAFYIWINSGIK